MGVYRPEEQRRKEPLWEAAWDGANQCWHELIRKALEEQQRKEMPNLQSLSRGAIDKDVAALLAEREWEVGDLRHSLAKLKAF